MAQGLNDQLGYQEILYPRPRLNDECVAAELRLCGRDCRHDAVEPFQL